MSAQFTAEAVRALGDSSSGGLEAFTHAARTSGRRAGEDLMRDLGLGSSFEDAVLAWRLVSKLSGMKFRVAREGGRAVFTHLVCPMLDAGGPSMCTAFCIPFVEGLTEALCPSCAVEMVTQADENRACVKALVKRGGGDA